MRRHGAELGQGKLAAAVTVKNGGPHVADPATRTKILDLRTDTGLAGGMAARYFEENRASLSHSLGRAPSADEVQMAYLLGAGGATRLIKAAASHPSVAADRIVPGAVHHNPGLFRQHDGTVKTAGEAVASLDRHFETARKSINGAIGARVSMLLPTDTPVDDEELSGAGRARSPGLAHISICRLRAKRAPFAASQSSEGTMDNMQLLTGDKYASYALLVMYAWDMCDQKLDPSSDDLDRRIDADGWTVVGIITGADDIVSSGPGGIRQQIIRPSGPADRKRYGFLAKSKTANSYVAVIRGTDGAEEWFDDFVFVAGTRPQFPGRVETGFADIYLSMQYRSLGAGAPSVQPGGRHQGRRVGTADVLVLGHSLGSTLATCLAYQLADAAALGTARVAAIMFASPPKLGDHDFVSGFAAQGQQLCRRQLRARSGSARAAVRHHAFRSLPHFAGLPHHHGRDGADENQQPRQRLLPPHHRLCRDAVAVGICQGQADGGLDRRRHELRRLHPCSASRCVGIAHRLALTGGGLLHRLRYDTLPHQGGPGPCP